MNIEKVCSAKGLVIYHYNFTDKNNKEVKTTKILFNINGSAIYVNTTKALKEKIGSVVLYDLGYDGRKWVVI